MPAARALADRPDVVALLRELLVEQRRTNELLERMGARGIALGRGVDQASPDAVDRVADAAGAWFGNGEFAVVELIASADTDAELRASLEGAIGRLGQGSARRLGHLLGRAARDGRVERVGKKTSVGAKWKVVVTS